jgi:hypothetical protein
VYGLCASDGPGAPMKSVRYVQHVDAPKLIRALPFVMTKRVLYIIAMVRTQNFIDASLHI